MKKTINKLIGGLLVLVDWKFVNMGVADGHSERVKRQKATKDESETTM
jgi:hypothetical protein